jgi:hypothetical protein
VTIAAGHGLAGRNRVLSAATNRIHHNSFAAEARITDRDTRRLFVRFGCCGCATETHQSILPPRHRRQVARHPVTPEITLVAGLMWAKLRKKTASRH